MNEIQVPDSPAELWAAVHAARRSLAEELATLTPDQWAVPTLCTAWTVEEVVAHLTAVASVGRIRWIRSVLGARFDFDLHNARRLAEHRGATTAGTLERFRAVSAASVGPSRHTAAWLGEVLVHGQDIRRPLGSSTTPSIGAATAVARFFASRDFAVPSRTTAAGLRLEATDGPFAAGAGPLVRGDTIALVMALAGRPAYLADLHGPGVAALRQRQPATGHR
ncbi:maleylpyruvate isomerase family mycothiol-dependent enzyme [Nakamurella deserti]|uniref:maleylpyruvate isomerase family mycothiol-dependent enzyme n=1 Tax=Nakamurella deserti TaxID=2164074 RepID=UPI000DBE6E22|nr:maleylpyruvate isomerase family mycothiol-dependent enzyme [Nakamurella deserti]